MSFDILVAPAGAVFVIGQNSPLDDGIAPDQAC
jgi:hypothetical protein